MSGSGINWAICKSASRSRQTTMPAPHHSVFTGRMPFLPPNQQRQSTEGITWVGSRNHKSRAQTPTGRGITGAGRDIFGAIEKYREYAAHGRHSQPYSVGGGSDAAFCCQYCSSWLAVATYWGRRPSGRRVSVSWCGAWRGPLVRSCRRTSTDARRGGTASDWTRRRPCTRARTPSADAAHAPQSAAGDTRLARWFHLQTTARQSCISDSAPHPVT